MKQITIKSALMRLVAVVLFTLGTISVSAQYYMNVVQKDGVKVQYLVSDIDSVYFSDQQSPVSNYEYVDLGLSVLWATCNVGATKPEEYGDYYAWGETEPKTTYDWSTYKWCNGSYYTQTKYNTSSSYGTVDNKTVLDQDDDVAHVKWGGSWRLPTGAELDELCDSCTWTWNSRGNTEFNGVAGYKVTSNKSGYTDRFIFLPAAGYRTSTGLDDVGSYGYYWSSSLYTGNPCSAFYLSFNSGYVGWRDYGRRSGFSVRPVCPSEEWLNNVSITLNSSLDSIVLGTTITLSATVKHGNEVIDSEVTWVSDNPSIASVSETGVVSGNAVGSTTITATCMGKTATCTITVIEPITVIVPQYVDLGLSVKWATFNVGATKPEEYGDYFAWGETETKTTYNWSTYKWCNGSYDTQTKYNTSSSYGIVDNKTVLDPDDDVAHVKWGGSWRLPTNAERAELRNSCTWTWYSSGNTEFNGVAGYKVISKKSGYTDRFIFLPAAGYRRGTGLDYVGSCGGYWSSSRVTGGPDVAYGLYFYSDLVSWDYYYRRSGYSVRPVCP